MPIAALSAEAGQFQKEDEKTWDFAPDEGRTCFIPLEDGTDLLGGLLWIVMRL